MIEVVYPLNRCFAAEIHKTSNWMRQNSLTVNSDKCLFMNFGKTSTSRLHLSSFRASAKNC